MAGKTVQQHVDDAEHLKAEADALKKANDYAGAAAKLKKSSDEYEKAAAKEPNNVKAGDLLEKAASAAAAGAEALADDASTYLPATGDPGNLDKASELYAEIDRSGNITGAAGARQQAADLYSQAAARYQVVAKASTDKQQIADLTAKEAAAEDREAQQHRAAAEAFKKAIACEQGKNKKHEAAEIKEWRTQRDTEQFLAKLGFQHAQRDHTKAAEQYKKLGEYSKQQDEESAADKSAKEENK